MPTSIERVYDTIGDVLGYERWWTDFVIRATGDALRPLFQSNHNWAMRRGERQIREYLRPS